MKKVIAVIIICVLLCGVALAERSDSEKRLILERVDLMDRSGYNITYDESSDTIIIIMVTTFSKDKSEYYYKRNAEDDLGVISFDMYRSFLESFRNFAKIEELKYQPNILCMCVTTDGYPVLVLCNGEEIYNGEDEYNNKVTINGEDKAEVFSEQESMDDIYEEREDWEIENFVDFASKISVEPNDYYTVKCKYNEERDTMYFNVVYNNKKSEIIGDSSRDVMVKQVGKCSEYAVELSKWFADILSEKSEDLFSGKEPFDCFFTVESLDGYILSVSLNGEIIADFFDLYPTKWS